MYMIVIFVLCAIGVMFYSFQAVNILLTFETKIFNSYRSKLVSKKIQMAMTTREQCRDRELFMSQAGAQPGGSKGSADPPEMSGGARFGNGARFGGGARFDINHAFLVFFCGGPPAPKLLQ